MECKKHEKSVRCETSLANVTKFFIASGSKSNDAVSVAADAFTFHAMKHHSRMKCSQADSRIKM